MTEMSVSVFRRTCCCGWYLVSLSMAALVALSLQQIDQPHPLDLSTPPSSTAIDVLSLTAEQLATMTTEERLRVQQLMLQQQQKQFLMTQQLHQQIQQQHQQQLKMSSPQVLQPSPPQPSPLMMSSANVAASGPHFQDVSRDKGPQQPPSPFPFRPPPGAAIPLEAPPPLLPGMRLTGSSLAQGSSTGMPTKNLREFLASISPQVLTKLTPQEQRQLLELLQQTAPGATPMQVLPPEVVPQLISREGHPGGAVSAMTCPRLSPGAMCSGRFHRCNQDQQCAKGAKCCPDHCGMICQTAVSPDGAILPGSLLVASCINPNCASAGFWGSSSEDKGNQCDAIKACTAGWYCCFDGCRNTCRPDMTANGHGGDKHRGGVFGNPERGSVDKNMLLMMMAASGGFAN